MSNEIGVYSFLPWLRHGIANQIDPTSTTGAGSRVSFHIRLKAEGEAIEGAANPVETIERNVELYGPGDIIGIDQRAIIKTEPRRRITNFEPNYLPYIDFYDEDFPWRYTPEVPANNRLRPWIMLVVLKEDEFENGVQTSEHPLPYISLSGADKVFPPIDQLWAWAHVHVNQDLASSQNEIVSTDMNAVLPKFETTLNKNPDIAYSRIMCPRKLDVSSSYHGFLIPVFESGRLAGLGLDPVGTPAVNHGAWEGNGAKPQAENFPYYYRWEFQTGTMGDFEYLVRLLEPQPVDNRVGRRDIDVQTPGVNLTGITDPDLGGVLRLGGALRIPKKALKGNDLTEFTKYENWDQADYPHEFQEDLAAFINLADDYNKTNVDDAHTNTNYDATIPDPDNPGETINDPDPLITPPIYGRWHAMVERVLTESDGTPAPHNQNWVHQLNLDPRHRVAANFGTEVVQKNQETYMRSAWEQIGDVIEANRRIRIAQYARYASLSWYFGSVLPLQANPVLHQRALVMTMPVQRRVISNGLTVSKRLKDSIIPPAIVSSEARRILRPRGRFMKLLPFDSSITTTNLIDRINSGKVTANPAKPPLDGAPTLDEVADAIQPAPDAVPPIIIDLLRRFPNLRRIIYLLLFILLIVILFAVVLAFVIVPIMVALVWFLRKLDEWENLLAPSEGIREENQTPDAVDRLPESPDFRLILDIDDSFRPTIGTTDSPEAINFKTALKDAYTIINASRQIAEPLRPLRTSLNLTQITKTLVSAINPAITIPRHIFNGIYIPPRIRDGIGERFVEAMAYPEFDLPMYEPLVKKSKDEFLPNLRFIEQNSISILETNQAFIEAYMVGLNHEFARELLWREYVTDQRGSYFRQFWDVTAYLHDSDEDPKILREKLKDIPPLHRWTKISALGDHDHREEDGDKEEEVVLVIRGELLKKYPTAVIYAHRAKWKLKDGAIDNTKERELDDPDLAFQDHPPRDKVKTPLYEAKVDPDIYFFGFDLKVEEAVGGTGEPGSEDPGWFFVIQERPGEARFGLDIGTGSPVQVWNDLGWGNIVPDTEAGDFIKIDNNTPTIQLEPLAVDGSDDEKIEQKTDDEKLRWHKDTHAAEISYILYQAPVMVAVHASEMMPDQAED